MQDSDGDMIWVREDGRYDGDDGIPELRIFEYSERSELMREMINIAVLLERFMFYQDSQIQPPETQWWYDLWKKLDDVEIQKKMIMHYQSNSWRWEQYDLYEMELMLKWNPNLATVKYSTTGEYLIFTLCWKEDWESTDEQNFAYTSKLNRFELLLKYGSTIENNVLFLQKTSNGNQVDGEYLLHYMFKLYKNYYHLPDN